MRNATLLGLAALSLLLYAIGLDRVPPHLHEAEVLFGLHAHAIATTGHDLYGRWLPLYFQMVPLGENTWWHPVIVYTTALWLQVAPFTESSLRVPSALVGTLDVVLLCLIARRLFASRAIVVAAGLGLALAPAHFIQSRIAMDYIYPVPFVLGWLLCLLVFLDTRRARWLFGATSLLGVGVYSYIASVIMMPVYAIATAAALVAAESRDRRLWIAAAAGFTWPLLLIPVWLWFHPAVVDQTLVRYGQRVFEPVGGAVQGLSLAQALEELRKPEHFASVPGRISLYWYFLDPVYLFISGGYASPMNSTRHVGVFLLPFLVLVPAGLWRIARRPDLPSVLVAAGFLTAPIAAVLAVPEPYAVDREMALLPFGALVAAYGLSGLWHAASAWGRRTAMLLVVAVPLHFGVFLYDYYIDYPPRAAFWFGLNHRGAVESLIAASSATTPAVFLSTERDLYLESYWEFAIRKWQRDDLRGKTVTDRQRVRDIDSAPSGSLFLVNRSDGDVSALLARPDLDLVADIAELADPQQYWVVRKR